MGFRSQVHGSLKVDLDTAVDRRARRFMGDGAAYTWIAMNQAIADAGLEPKDVSNERTGLIVGSGGPSTKAIVAAADTARTEPVKGPKKVGPFAVPKAMSSTCSANLSTWFKTKGVNYSISSACSTSANCIGNAYEMIQWGKQDVMFAGGGEELDWTLSVLFDAMGAMSSHYNDTPEKASRAYDKNRDGFVISGGGGILILEELQHAKARGAKIYAETDRLWRHRRRRRHGGAFGRRRGALHAHGDRSTRRRRSTTSTRTRPRRRSATSPKSRRSRKSSASTCRRSAPRNR